VFSGPKNSAPSASACWSISGVTRPAIVVVAGAVDVAGLFEAVQQRGDRGGGEAQLLSEPVPAHGLAAYSAKVPGFRHDRR
jgi:hypothetical protein